MKNSKTISFILVFIAVIAIFFGGYFYYRLHKINLTPSDNNKMETKDLLDKVSRLYLIPVGESPTIATVSDPETLKKGQAFFQNAQKDDKVLIFIKAGKAILYRPSLDKIIDTSTINNNVSSDNNN